MQSSSDRGGRVCGAGSCSRFVKCDRREGHGQHHEQPQQRRPDVQRKLLSQSLDALEALDALLQMLRRRRDEPLCTATQGPSALRLIPSGSIAAGLHRS
jgi:hypothetical protein